MGRDTKIGLLVGMGFIVCFAIILSNRGQVEPGTDRTGVDVSSKTQEMPARAHPSVAERRARDIGRRTHPGQSSSRPHQRTRGSAKPQTAEPAARPGHARETPLPPQADSARGQREIPELLGDRDGPPATAIDRFTKRGRQIDATPAENIPLPPTDAQRKTDSSDGEDQSDDGPIRPLPERRPGIDLSTPEAVLAAVESGRSVPRAARLPVPNTGGQAASGTQTRKVGGTQARQALGKHEVEPGDTLTRIARKHYGAAKPSVIKAIYEANTDTMTSPDRLVVGHKIVLPALKPAADPSPANTSPATTETSETAVAADSSSGREPATYEIKPGDTLTRIARAQYGSASQRVINAICEANRATITDPDRIVVGTRIVLPTLGGGDSASRDGQVLAAVTPWPVADTARRDDAKAGSGRSRSSSRPAEPKAKWEWYRVEKGDVYSTIAAEQLGTAKRWPELADLNKDIFPDPSRIQYGVRIRIPVDKQDARSVASARGATR